jgi:histidyl-tRNA synthetase
MERDPNLIQPVTGFPEWLPGERLIEQRFLDKIRATFERFGFASIETAAMEKSAVLASKGEINKQIYSVIRPNVPEEVDKDTGLSLHFDLTIPFARYVAQNYGKLVFPFRRYQIQKVWRGERPQRGRFREFYQCDIDIIGEGSLDLLADAEMPLVINEVFTALDLGAFVIRISNRKILQGLLKHYGIEGDQAEETLRGIDRLPKLKGGWAELAGWLASELSLAAEPIATLETLLLEPKSGGSALDKLRDLPIDNYTFRVGIQELGDVIDNSAELGLPDGLMEVDLSITRGLDYYTGTVYETFLIGQEKTFGSVCSGGRYDNLASHFIDRVLPGVGISIGLTRLFAALLEKGEIKADRHTPAEVMVTVPERNRLRESLKFASSLRKAGIAVELFVQDIRHDKQIKIAVRKGIPFAVIPWPERLDETSSVEVRNLITGEREMKGWHEVASFIKNALKKARRNPMIREYIMEAMQHAHYEIIDQEGAPFYGEIPGLQGVMAVGATLEECRTNLEDSLDAWLALGLQLGHEIPPMGNGFS